MKRYSSTPYSRLRAAVAGALLFPGLALAATVDKSQDGSSATITIPVTLINIQATCDLTFTGLEGGLGNYSYSLGSLSPGQQRQHTPFKAVIDCRDVQGNEGVSTALTASVRQGSVTGNRIRMLVDGQENAAGPELWLEAGGQPVPLNGTAFCQGNALDRNECSLTPFTQVPNGAPGGQVSATVVFDVTYV
ncbi:hypothetical protein ACV38A_003984 [Escherichia coli]|uniref:hypothetical protein n=1 Tax=Escherichia coli TaxID=562 RepID=UPI000665E8C0|nr:hypothetical protein [Escherichia coli]EGJ8836522.1 hypothetical protein [Salmonella enterica]EGO4308609.1 hypothetical protein [Escherichia coli]EKC8925767.1 hypothetical protein [Escherichia coli]